MCLANKGERVSVGYHYESGANDCPTETDVLRTIF